MISFELLPWNSLALAWSAYAIGILSPGPNVLAVMGTSLEHGRRAGTALAAGMVTGTLFWGFSTAVGLTALLAAFAFALTVIKFAGAAYLLWLAYQSFRSALSQHEPGPQRASSFSRGRLYRRGLLIQLSNPKAALTWIAIMSIAVGETAVSMTAATVVAGCLFISFLGHMSYAILFSLPKVGSVYFRIRRIVQGSLGVLFCFASWKLATSKM